MIRPVLLKCPDEFIPNTNISQNRSASADTPPLCLSGTHDTSGLIPPLRTPCPVITGEVAISAELIASFYVRSLIAFHLSCLVLFAMIAVYLMSTPSLISGRLCCYC
jgi:hypothetical protein